MTAFETAILDELAKIRRLLEQFANNSLAQQQAPARASKLDAADREVLATLLPAILQAFGERNFIVADLFEDPTVGERFSATCLSGRQLGRLFVRANGEACNGVRVFPIGQDRRGLVWRVTSDS